MDIAGREAPGNAAVDYAVYLYVRHARRGSRRGVMAAPGMKDEDGEAVGELSAPLRWAVDVAGGASVRIEHGPRPPPPTEAEVAAAVAWNDANYRG